MYYKRSILPYLKKVLEKEPAIVLIGTRQVGKTTLLKKMEHDFVSDSKKTFYFNLELPSSLDLFSSGVEGFLEYLKIKGVNLNKKADKEYVYIFVDEFQYINNAGKFLKAIIDSFESIKIIASGSSSVEIQKSLKESLVGRKRIINIFPLDFLEHLYFNNIKEADCFKKLDLNAPLTQPICNILIKLFYEFVIWGGMPKVVIEKDFEEKRAILEEIVSSYLQKDIKGLLGSENLMSFNNLMILLAEESSSIISINSMSKTLGLQRKDLERNIFILQNTFVNYQVGAFYKNKRKEISKSKKSIFYDTGIRNYLIKNMSDIKSRIDSGRLIETIVYNEIKKNLKKGMEIYYWRTQHQTEIDLILKYDQNIVPIEVKAGRIEIVPRAIVSFAETYKIPFAVVINKDYWCKRIVNGLKVYFIPYFLSAFIPSFVEKNL